MNTILSALIGGAAGLAKFLFTSYMENRRMELEIIQARVRMTTADRERAANVKDKGVSYTRRVLALLLCCTLCAPVWYGFFWPDATITVPQTFLERGFWEIILPWKEATEVTKYVTVPAPILAMPIYDLAAMAVGFYFGSGGSRTR